LHVVLFWSAFWATFAFTMNGDEGFVPDVSFAAFCVLAFPVVEAAWWLEVWLDDEGLVLTSISNAALWAAAVALLVRWRRRVNARRAG